MRRKVARAHRRRFYPGLTSPSFLVGRLRAVTIVTFERFL
jgi:hypothetical protein